ncbi:DUF397 domain-containing protein [Streptomyces sp. NPDC002928]|uniref:DUF397 domain-containing protein n=1 Tax=Streptomyces sp. NPDC002928 TaxID=3154440 RepID=UPI0033BE2B7A
MTANDLAPEGAWFKSSYSSGSEGNCLEATDLAPKVGIRDSKDKKGPALVFPRSSWTAFVAGVRVREFGDSRA